MEKRSFWNTLWHVPTRHSEKLRARLISLHNEHLLAKASKKGEFSIN
jgi:hypothetical protein